MAENLNEDEKNTPKYHIPRYDGGKWKYDTQTY